eukprot:TRINITY_DN4764_c0_g1_i2.p1 TRINITY_DN4764_c0_g1~~TRINITY_DN4764_c0_g1_i2.p1  ORF type:complete len:231 (+),score=54.95 TRINITY_DN4764_c0_g1_i2:53-745(+)
MLSFLLLIVVSVCILGCNSELPSHVLDLSTFKLQLPTNPAREIDTAALQSFSLPPYFYATNVSGSPAVIFWAQVNGTHTSGSEYPRTELSESGKPFQPTQGTNSMMVKEAIMHLPDKRPEVVCAQILGEGGPVLQVRLNGKNLVVYGDPSGDVPPLQENYVLGTPFTLEIVVEAGTIKIYYNSALKLSFPKSSGSGWYFKAGAYVQSNLSYDAPTAYGEVAIFNLKTVHA